MNCHAHAAQVLIPSAVLAASLMGSGHCALMCGGLVTMSARSSVQQALYHFGRLAMYSALGFLSGMMGESAAVHLPEAASTAAAWGLALSFIVLGWMGWKGSGWHISLPGARFLSALSQRLFALLGQASKTSRNLFSLAAGALSIFLPCGWLYSFVLAAVSTADPVRGALLMSVFWAGTLPALAVFPWVLRKAAVFPEALAPRISSLLLMAAGVLPIVLRYAR